MTRTATTSREQSVQSDTSVVSGRPTGAAVVADAGLGPARNNARSILDEGSHPGPSDTKDSAMCSRNPWRTVRKDNKTLTYKPDCMCWGCDECRSKLKDKWIHHAQKCFASCRNPLAYLFCHSDEVEKFARWLRRHNCDYFRIRRNPDRYLFIFSCNEVPSMAARCSVRDACDAFGEKVNEIHDSAGGNPVSSSRSWSLPQRNHSGWDVIAIGPAPAQIRTAAFVTTAKCQSLFGITVCSGDSSVIDHLCEMIASLAAHYPTRPINRFDNVNADTLFEDSANDYHRPWGSQDEEQEYWRTKDAVEDRNARY
jgi:hypothetical protein